MGRIELYDDRVYLMISKYLKPIAEVDAAREDHLTFLAEIEAKGLAVTAGRQDPPVGGIVVLDVDSADEAHQVMAGDPYVARGLAAYTATGWVPTRGLLAGYERVRRTV